MSFKKGFIKVAVIGTMVKALGRGGVRALSGNMNPLNPLTKTDKVMAGLGAAGLVGQGSDISQRLQQASMR